jgi:hypothetical protein
MLRDHGLDCIFDPMREPQTMLFLVSEIDQRMVGPVRDPRLVFCEPEEQMSVELIQKLCELKLLTPLPIRPAVIGVLAKPRKHRLV